MSIFTLNKDICQIVFEVSSDKCAVRLTDMGDSIEDYRESLEPDSKYMTKITIKVFAINENEEKVMDVGFLNAIYFEAEVLFGAELSFPLLCDMISSDAHGMAAAVTDRHGVIMPSICQSEQNLMYIEEVYVEKPCRGFGVGRYLLDNLVPLLSHSLNLRPHVCVTLPYPQQKTLAGDLSDAERSAADADLPRLVRFYEKAGYTKLGCGEYMYKRHTDSLDELFEMLKG